MPPPAMTKPAAETGGAGAPASKPPNALPPPSDHTKAAALPASGGAVPQKEQSSSHRHGSATSAGNRKDSSATSVPNAPDKSGSKTKTADHKKQASSLPKGGNSTLPSSGASSGAPPKAKSSGSAPAGTPSTSPGAADASKSTPSEGAPGDGYTLPLPDLSFGCKQLQDLWNAIIGETDGDRSYWGVHLLSVGAIGLLYLYKQR